MELRGGCALVTGGAVRVGRALVLALAGEGMRVVVHHHSSRAEADSLVSEIRAAGGDAVRIAADLSDPTEVARLGREAEAAWGGVDVLVNSASLFHDAGLRDTDLDTWNATIALNLRAPFLLTQQIGQAMAQRGRGVIVNIADLAGLQAWRGYAAHGISKAGLVHMTRIAARELAPDVRVVAIAPGTVLPPANMPAEQVESLAERIPLRRVGAPEDVVKAMLYALAADFVTGEVLRVDGGRMLGA